MSSGGDKPPSPWLEGVTGVTGVVPPGRRLSSDPRPTRWSASGVRGVTPPGRQTADAKAASDLKRANQQVLRRRQRGAERLRPRSAAPQAGFLPDVFADIDDPPDLQAFLKLLSDFLEDCPPQDEALDDIHDLVTQSRAPFELVVGFTVMSALVGKDEGLRQDFAGSLERGANAFFNLARRLNPRVRVPRGVIPEVVDALFFDLPDLAAKAPFAFATDAFVRLMPLLRTADDDGYDERLVTFAQQLRRRFIEGRSFGDQPLARLFPWERPAWAPADLEDVGDE